MLATSASPLFGCGALIRYRHTPISLCDFAPLITGINLADFSFTSVNNLTSVSPFDFSPLTHRHTHDPLSNNDRPFSGERRNLINIVEGKRTSMILEAKGGTMILLPTDPASMMAQALTIYKRLNSGDTGNSSKHEGSIQNICPRSNPSLTNPSRCLRSALEKNQYLVVYARSLTEML
ncbi:hypothetical protein LguiA_002157 [Lonicera macranthoides]